MSSRRKHGKSDYSNRRVTIVLGEGLLLDGGLPLHVVRRLDKAIEIYCDHTIFVCSSIFTLNKPQVLKNGFVLSEAKEMASYIKRLSPSSQVFLENASFDTIGSAIFTRMFYDFLLKGTEVTVVTSDFHIERTSIIFTKIFGLNPFLDLKSLEFVSSESGLNSNERINHEKNAVRDFNQKSDQWLDFDNAKLWLFSHHDNYVKFKSNPNFTAEKITGMGY